MDTGEVPCGPGAAFIYTKLDIAPSGAARKRMEARANAERAALGDCPRGCHACAILGSDNYECLDTDSELESCGGCVDGYYDNKNGTVGTDCAAIKGVAVGGVSCIRGHCEVSQCRNGYRLKSGRCV